MIYVELKPYHLDHLSSNIPNVLIVSEVRKKFFNFNFQGRIEKLCKGESCYYNFNPFND